MSPETDNWTLRSPSERTNGSRQANGQHPTDATPLLPAVIETRLTQMQAAAKAERQQMMTEAVRTAAEQVLEGIHAPALEQMVGLVTDDRKERQAAQTKLSQKLEAIAAAARAARPSRAQWIIAALSLTMALVSMGTAVYLLTQAKPKPAQAISSQQLMTVEQGKELAKQREELAKVVATLEAKKSDLAAMEQQLTDTRKSATETASALQVIAESRKQAQADLVALEELKQKHRGSLMPGQDGKMYAEVLETTTPFQYQGRWYVELRSR